MELFYLLLGLILGLVIFYVFNKVKNKSKSNVKVQLTEEEKEIIENRKKGFDNLMTYNIKVAVRRDRE